MRKKVLSAISALATAAIIALAALLTLPRLMGCTPFAVLSGSMEPSYPVGSIVLVRAAAPQDIRVGDAIMFSMGNGMRVTHRVTRIDAAAGNVITKGDANSSEDFTPVLYDQIIGKAILCLPLLGYLSLFLQTGWGIACCLLVFAMVALLLWLVKNTRHGETTDVK